MLGYAPHGAIFSISNDGGFADYAFTSDAFDSKYVLYVHYR